MRSPTENRSKARRKKTRSRMKACIPCQKQKVRCSSSDNDAPCQRCATRGITCVFRSIPPYWKPNFDENLLTNMAEDLQSLHTAVNNVLTNKYQPALAPLKTMPTIPAVLESPSPTASAAAHLSPVIDHQTEEILDVPIKGSESAELLNEVPIKSLYEITRLESLRSRQLSPVSTNNGTSVRSQMPQDLVSDGKLDLADANRLIQTFLNQTDHYLYGITNRFEDIHTIRCASSLLFTAICTVSALHEPRGESLYHICSSELRRLVSDFVFAAQVNVDDFQGLCVASFWLSDIAWSVSGLAIRRAIEFQLAKSFDFIVGDKINQGQSSNRIRLHGQDEALHCLRVWYLFYICDRHLSILYGRPSSFGDQRSVNKWEKYLDAIPECITDVRIASQIDLLLLLDKVTALFGTNVEVCIPVNFKSQLEGFNEQIDQWIITWTNRYESHEHVGSFPHKALILHYQFAKLFVSSHVFRARSSRARENPIPRDYHDIAQIAIKSARAIVDFITHDLDIRAGFISTPHYYHTMIAYACSFLLKLATNQHNHLGIEQQHILATIQQVTELCQGQQCTRYHLVHWMGAGLQELSANCEKIMMRQPDNYRSKPRQDDNGDSVSGCAILDHHPNQDIRADARTLIELDNVRNAVRQVTTNLPEFIHDDSVAINNRAGNGGQMFTSEVGTIDMETEWEALLPSFNLEHMGFGLL